MLSELLITHEPFRSPPSWLGFQLGIQLSIQLVFNWYSTVARTATAKGRREASRPPKKRLGCQTYTYLY